MLDLDLLLRPAVLAPTVAIVGFLIYQLFFAGIKLPDLPIVGAKDTDWFPVLQAQWRNSLDFKQAVHIADTQYRDKPVRLPLLGTPTQILLPRSDTQFVTEQPENVLSLHTQAMQSLQIKYTAPKPNLGSHPVPHHIISSTLTGQIGNLIPDVVEELVWGFDEHWGNDKEWKEVGVYDTCRKVIGSATNRVFVGKPLCRNPEFLRLGIAYAQAVPITAQILRIIWKPIRPLVALFLTIPIKRLTRAWNNLIFPEIKQRLDEWDSRQQDPEKKKGDSYGRNDFLQWTIAEAKETGNPYRWKPAILAGQILLLNFAAIHTSSFTLTSAVFDLAYGKKEYVEELRREIETVLAEFGGEWNKRALAKMIKLDSTMRESARLNSFATTGMNRIVTAKNGVTTPSGVTIPKGCNISVPSYVVLHDDAVYPDAAEFKPFRFAEQRADESVEYVKRASKAWATTSNEYLPFGHGRNACPGRFFAANEIKLMMAHILMNYDLEPTADEKPMGRWFGLNRVPAMEATVRIRRREAI